MPNYQFVKTFVFCLVALWLNYGCTSSKDKPDPVIQAPQETVKDTTPSTTVNYNRILGRWLRPDGGYILEIRSATPDGKLDVGYYNPNPIHVARAEWVMKDSKLYVLVELQDTNYPGSTYGLEYKAGTDHLVGTYYQALEKSTFDVEFVREK